MFSDVLAHSDFENSVHEYYRLVIGDVAIPHNSNRTRLKGKSVTKTRSLSDPRNVSKF